MKVAAIGPGTLLALKAEAARIYPLKTTVDGRIRTHEEPELDLTIYEGSWFSISLPEHRPTGYRWHLAPNDGEVVVMEDRFQTPHNKPDAIGTRTFTLKISTADKSPVRLAFELRRPWHVMSPPAARKDVTVEVLPEPAVRIMR
ncbi:MAG TPA: protease inhibitor I42 family protein [Candidatus Xenobia bacterium]